MPVLVRDVVSDAFSELGLFSPTTPIPSQDSTFALNKLGRLVDNWNVIREAVWTVKFFEFTIVPSLQPSTIGPDAATFSVTQRPVEIEGANVVLNNVTPNVRQPINIRDDEWWRLTSVQDVTSTFPTDLYYSPDWDSSTDRNGRIYLWPVPTVAYGLELQLRVILAQQGINDAFSMPPGYRDAMTLTLAESMASAYGKTPSVGLLQAAAQARARIFDVNNVVPNLWTQDSGMPSNGRNRATFNYRSGLPMTGR